VDPFTPEEALKFLKAVKGDRLETLWTVILGTGLRHGEALGLKWKDVDLTQGTLSVTHTLQRVRGEGRKLVDPKSESSRRTIHLPAFVVKSLKEHRLRQQQEARWNAKKWTDSGHVFTSRVGTPLEFSNVHRAFKALLERAGVKEQRIHDLRHCCATLLLVQGVSMKVVQETLGHSNFKLTADTYSHVIPSLKRDAAERMESLLGVENAQ
jgi:integrase